MITMSCLPHESGCNEEERRRMINELRRAWTTMSPAACFRSFQRDGYVCGGCNQESVCGMGAQSARFAAEFVESVDPGRQIAGTHLTHL